MDKKHIYIGLAWPYVNGTPHLGHASSLIVGDVLARYHRLKGDHVLMTSGSDCYGTPIALEAEQQGVSPMDIADKYHEEFKIALIDGLGFSYDIYTRTTEDNHAHVVQELFLDLLEKGYLYTKKENALYSPMLDRFLPDRFVEGVCPFCAYDGARGDQCDNCGKLLDPLELKTPRINPKILNNKKEYSADDLRLEVKESEHFYLKLSALQEHLEKWIHSRDESWRINASSFAKGFLKQGLHDRAVTRDTDWGVEIPVSGYESKRIYVWFEAVTGYYSSCRLWAKEQGSDDAWKDWWLGDNAYHYYVHGKDNIPFHTIIWPAMLLAEGNLHTPDQIVSSEYLNLEGKQFSKSRNWAVWLPDFLETFNGDLLRFYLIVNGPETSDANFSWKEFQKRVNGELIGTFGNLVNRVLSLSAKHFPDGVTLPESLDNESQVLLTAAEAKFSVVGELIEAGKFRAAFQDVLHLAQEANQYIDAKAPWAKIKEEGKEAEVNGDLAVLMQVIRCLHILISPFLPFATTKIDLLLGESVSEWTYPQPKDTIIVQAPTPIFDKVEDEVVEEQISKLDRRIGG